MGNILALQALALDDHGGWGETSGYTSCSASMCSAYQADQPDE